MNVVCVGMLSLSTGFTVNHMMTFKRHRDAYLSNTVVETNRLVVRLEKVLTPLNLFVKVKDVSCIVLCCSAVPETQGRNTKNFQANEE